MDKTAKEEDYETVNESNTECKSFGTCLRKIRRENKITSDQLGLACGVNPVFIRQIEAGSRLPSMSKLIKLCNNLQVSPEHLLESEMIIRVSESQWGDFIHRVEGLSPSSRHIVMDVLHSLVQDLSEPEKKTEEGKKSDVDREEFGRRLKKVRQEKRFSSEQLASLCKVNPVFIRQIETGARLPSLPVFVKLCNNLEVSPAYLLGNEVKIEVTGFGWKEMIQIQCNMTPGAQEITKDVLHSLIKNLME